MPSVEVRRCTPGRRSQLLVVELLEGAQICCASPAQWDGLIAGYAGHTLLAVAGLVVLVASSTGLLTALTTLGPTI